jgi:PRC-barrel domain protein
MNVMRGSLEGTAGLCLAILLAILLMGAPLVSPPAIQSARAADTPLPDSPAGAPDAPRADAYTIPDVPPGAIPGTKLQSLLGRELKTRDEDPGRIIDILCDSDGQVHAAVVELGGFLGIGMRRIAVHWSALRFDAADPKRPRLILEVARDELRSAPEYKPGEPVEVLVGRPD